MSALGTKQTWAGALHMSAFGGRADILHYADLLANKPIVEPAEECSADNAINQGVNRPNNH